MNETTLPVRPVLTHAVVRKMLDAAVAYATAQGWRLHFSIVDAGGNLLGYLRMDDSILLGIEVSLLKARTSAKLASPSERPAGFAFGDGGPGPFAFVPGLVMLEGGLPIMSGGHLVGAIGISGSTAVNDGICARAALDAVAADLG